MTSETSIRHERAPSRRWRVSPVSRVALVGLMIVTGRASAQSAMRDSVPMVCSTRVLRVRHATSRDSTKQPAIIRVTVTDSAGKPLNEATVLYRPRSSFVAEAFTDTNGVAVLRVPSRGASKEATLAVRVFWYAVRDTAVTMAPGDTVTAIAVLCPRPPAQSVTVETQTGTSQMIRISSRPADSTRAPLPNMAGCLPPTSAGGFLANVKSIASGDYPFNVVRDSVAHMPKTPRADVQLVEDSTLCAAAAAAYDREFVRLNHGAPRIRAVDVIKVGASGYVIIDPTEQGGEWTTAIFVDPSMTRFLGYWAD